MAKSIRSNKKRLYRAEKRRSIFEPIYAARVKRLSSRLKKLFSENVDDLDKMIIDQDQNNNMNRNSKDIINMNIDETQISSTKLQNEDQSQVKHAVVGLKKKKFRKIKIHKKKTVFWHMFL
ncbi:hypothetical protein PNEG_03473 [Pneumocystis murina B123]|uniref:DUF2423 domain-containing protein n=1 Tax=Pneumocystis murina (strain B123) TaxID=1069680 RepID=M7P2C0_PNEMU|nr:hypothetical protein PNEG_03473 [Pneumocystis murina B123]EMR08030.1 hypothetical protein PNEG_03473 [Pneumocystis murina B123]